MSDVRSRERWLLAGQDLLRAGGVPAVKLEALAEATGLTTGSFYHHFANVPAYLAELARYYGADQVEGFLAGVDDPDPVARLDSLRRLAADELLHPLDMAMRDWAGTDPGAADAVRAADAALLRFVEAAFGDLGFDRPEARVRAVLLLSAGVARVHLPWPEPARATERALRILCRPDAETG